MSDRYRLVALGNEELVAALSGLVRRENDALSDLLAHLAELDQRRLYLDLGFTSLFAYCTERLGFCKSSAGRRIAAARVCRKYPEAFVRVAKGELQLCALSVLDQHLNPENATELFDACSHRSFEQVELVLAARFPKPDVRDLIRRLPHGPEARSAGTPNIGSGSVSGPAISPDVAAVMNARGRVEPLSADRFGVHFTADAEFRELLEQVRALASHRQPKGELLPLMKQALLAYRSELRKTRFGLDRKSRRALGRKASATQSAKRSRYVPAEVAREVYDRDGGCCSFVAPDGRRCGTRQFLELDHVKPWAERGPTTVENLRLRCRAHNQHSARSHFGAEWIREAVMRGSARQRDIQSKRLLMKEGIGRTKVAHSVIDDSQLRTRRALTWSRTARTPKRRLL